METRAAPSSDTKRPSSADGQRNEPRETSDNSSKLAGGLQVGETTANDRSVETGHPARHVDPPRLRSSGPNKWGLLQECRSRSSSWRVPPEEHEAFPAQETRPISSDVGSCWTGTSLGTGRDSAQICHRPGVPRVGSEGESTTAANARRGLSRVQPLPVRSNPLLPAGDYWSGQSTWASRWLTASITMFGSSGRAKGGVSRGDAIPGGVRPTCHGWSVRRFVPRVAPFDAGLRTVDDRRCTGFYPR